MKNTLMDLNNALFEQIERMQDDKLSDEELEREIKRTHAVAKVAEVIVHNGELALKTMQAVNEYGMDEKEVKVPVMLEAGR